jgi:L-arabinose isomerase
MDMGDRFRLLVNPCDVVPADEPLPNLPVARVVWEPHPSLEVAAGAWILAGGAHHTGFSMAITREHMEDFAEIAGVEHVLIDDGTTIREIKKELKWNELYYRLARGI